ncbi:tyrosine-type recombinase/integrase, partial [Escherichia coli]
EWVHVQLHQQKGMISLSPPTICNSADYLKFREILQEVKPDLPKGQATHVMRHTFATHFMMNGGNIVTLQRILGHATIQQTMTYAHFSPDFLLDAINFNPLAESVHKLSID